MSDPITTLIDRNPTSAVLKTPRTPKYDPRVTTPADPGPVETTVMGLYARIYKDGLLVDGKALLTIKNGDLPAGFATNSGRVVVDTETYTVTRIRKRKWRNITNGWTLELAR